MKPDIPRLFPIWFLATTLLVVFLLASQCGCRTGGNWVGGGSGVKQVIAPSDLEKQPNGTFKLKPKDVTKPEPVIKNESAKSKPTFEPKSAEAKETKNEVKAAGLITPFEPTITTTPKVNVKPIIKNPPAKIIEGDGGCVVITDSEGKPEIAGPCEATPKEEAAVTVKWMELFAFYFLAAMLLIFIWIVYDIYKEYGKVKNTKSTRKKTAKKKTPSKKASSRKKAPRKKRGA